MNYQKEDLLHIYNKISDIKLEEKALENIISKINLITRKIDFDEIELIHLIDVLLKFQRLDKLDKICEESLYLLSKILGNDNELYNEDKKYFCIRLKHLLLPWNLNKCDNENDKISHLAEFDIMIDNMVINLNNNDLELLKKYNEDIYEILIRYKKIINKYENILNIKKDINEKNILNAIIINSTITRLITVLYFKLRDYDYNYDLIEKVFDKIIDNYSDYIFECSIYDIYQDGYNIIYNPENISKEYEICINLLDREFNPPIQMIKERRY